MGFYFFQDNYSEVFRNIGKYIDIDLRDTILNTDSLEISFSVNNSLDSLWNLQIYLNAVDGKPFQAESVINTIVLNNDIKNANINVGTYTKGYHFISGVGVFKTNENTSYITFFDDFNVK